MNIILDTSSHGIHISPISHEGISLSLQLLFLQSFPKSFVPIISFLPLFIRPVSLAIRRDWWVKQQGKSDSAFLYRSSNFVVYFLLGLTLNLQVKKKKKKRKKMVTTFYINKYGNKFWFSKSVTKALGSTFA